MRLQLRDPERNFKPRDRVTTAEDKLFVLLNEALSDQPAGLEYGLRQEADLVVRHGQRIATAMAKYDNTLGALFLHAQPAHGLHRYYMHQGHLAASANALTLARSLRHRLWDNSTLPTRQLPNVGQVTAGRLRAAGITCLRDLASKDPRWVEQVTARHYPFGSQLQHALTQLLPPRVELHLQPLRTLLVAR